MAVSLVSAIGMIGCDKKPSKPNPEKPAETKTSAAPKSEAETISEAIALLPEAERKVAEAQRTCPVGDAPLGSMGMPYKVTVQGRDVYLCCEGCQGALEKDPEKYFAIMDAKK